jgi:response regulator RpfG family c-di-GMP phosphodiesterase
MGEAIAEIKTNSGRLYDPDVVKHCVTCLELAGESIFR